LFKKIRVVGLPEGEENLYIVDGCDVVGLSEEENEPCRDGSAEIVLTSWDCQSVVLKIAEMVVTSWNCQSVVLKIAEMVVTSWYC
jgi:hypothetical protein